MRSAILLLGFVLAGCQMEQTAVAATEVNVDVNVIGTYRCELDESFLGSGVSPATGPRASDLSPFVLRHMSSPSEPNRFEISAETGVTVGVGEKRSDQRWVISEWKPKDANGPFVTLMTLLPKGGALVSVRSGKHAHVTFPGSCRLVSGVAE